MAADWTLPDVASVVGAFGTCHSPQVTLPGEQWPPYGLQEVDSGRLAMSRYTSVRGGDDMAAELALPEVQARADRCERAIQHICAELKRLSADVVVVIGDDQREIYLEDGIPAFGIYCGDTLWDWPPGMSVYPSLMKDAYWAYHADHAERYPTAPELGRYVVGGLTDLGFDVTITTQQHEGRGLGHAFTFVRLRLMDETPIAMLPIMVNTYYPPNQPTPDRCYDFGRALRKRLDAWDSPARVVLVASGGLSHPVVDEALDNQLLQALTRRDERTLRHMNVEQLYEGNSEIRNWIVVGAALADAQFQTLDYVPGYRSLKGSGCGMAFGQWNAPAPPR